MMDFEHQSPYEAIGGAEKVAQLVDAFYKRVVQDPDLSPIFPDDIIPVRDKQYLFLTQFFGGPPLYTQQIGSPMMRARHLPFPITPTRAKAWLKCMKEAMDEIKLEGPVREFLYQRLTQTAYHMVNTEDEEN